MSAGGGKGHADVNSWFLSLPEGQQVVLREDKWMLASAAFDAGKSDPVRAALVEALKPFAKLQLKPGWHDETPTAVLVTVGDIRRADAALKAAGVEP